MNENDVSKKCMNKCLDEVVENDIRDIFVTEENMNTVSSKYWNSKWVDLEELNEDELRTLNQYVYFYCLNKIEVDNE